MKRIARIEQAMEGIRKSHRGRLTKRAVVDAARNKRHSLHREFDWNDRRMADKARLIRAGELIRLVTVVVTHNPIRIVCPAFVKDPKVPQRVPGYIAVTSEELNMNDAEHLIVMEVDRIAGGIERARGLALELEKRFPGLVNELASALEKIVCVRQRIASRRRKGAANDDNRRAAA